MLACVIVPAILLGACGREPAKQPSAAGATPDTPASTLLPSGSRIQAPAAGPASASSTSACPATGQWTDCAVFQRLDRAGLAPGRDSSRVTEPPLAISGSQLRIGNSDLEVYIYPDARAREADERKLDRAKYVSYESPVTMQAQPTLITSVNLIAILHSRNDHQRERVADALTAGPPQP